MTRPAAAPGRLYYLLALYAALDQAVTEFDDPNIARTVERFLPGTTGENQRGWSSDLAGWLGREFPDLNPSLRNIADGPPLSRPELSRLVYVVGALAHIPAYIENNDRLFAEVLGLAAPEGVRSAEDKVRGTDTGSELLDLLQEGFNRRQDWDDVTAYAALKGWLDATVAIVPLCNACLTTQGGIQCVVVDTSFEDASVSMAQVEAIADPQNWDETAGEFFCSMTPLVPQTLDGWGRILETVSAWCGSGLPVLKTDLKYFKADYPNQAVLQYDLDDLDGPFPGRGDGQVTVDKGWIKLTTGTSANPNVGVTVATRKVVHIDPLSPVAQKVFVCVMGYGQAAMEMLLGGALHPPPNAVPWV